jgi:hypothetical protein
MSFPPRPQAPIAPPSSGLAPGAGRRGSSNDISATPAPDVGLIVWSHADAERSVAIRRTPEAGRSRKESAQSLVAARLKGLRADTQGLTYQARRNHKRSGRGLWAANGGATDAETDGGISESNYEVGSIGQSHHNPGESTLFLPGDTVFWLPYALGAYILYTCVWLRSINVTFLSPCV